MNPENGASSPRVCADEQTTETKSPLRPYMVEAFRAYNWAREKSPELLNACDRQVFEFIRSGGECPFQISPSFASFQRAMATARRHYGVPKLAVPMTRVKKKPMPTEPLIVKLPEQFKSVADVLDWYTRIEAGKPAGEAQAERIKMRTMFRIQLGHVSIADCRPAHLLAFIDAQTDVKSNWTKRRIKSSIGVVFSCAAAMGVLDRNPFLGLKLPMGPAGRDWTKEEYQAVLRQSTAWFRRFLVFLRFSGARPGEASAIKWSDVNFEGSCILLQEHKTVDAVGAPRRIFLNRVTVKLLEFMRRMPPSRSNYVFATRYDTKFKNQLRVRRLRQAREKCGLSSDVKLHGLRHTFATSAICQGLDVATLAQLVGHKSLGTTARYLHMATKNSHLETAAARAVGITSPKSEGRTQQPEVRSPKSQVGNAAKLARIASPPAVLHGQRQAQGDVSPPAVGGSGEWDVGAC